MGLFNYRQSAKCFLFVCFHIYVYIVRLCRIWWRVLIEFLISSTCGFCLAEAAPTLISQLVSVPWAASQAQSQSPIQSYPVSVVDDLPFVLRCQWSLSFVQAMVMGQCGDKLGGEWECTVYLNDFLWVCVCVHAQCNCTLLSTFAFYWLLHFTLKLTWLGAGTVGISLTV